MTLVEGLFLIDGITIGLGKAKELFRQSTDAKGGCRMLSLGEDCKCFLCLCDQEIKKAKETRMASP